MKKTLLFLFASSFFIVIMLFSSTTLAIDVNWSSITDPIGELFTGNGVDSGGIFGGDEIIMGVFLFLILFILTLIFGLGMLVGSVVLIPSLFAVFRYIPDLRIIVAIVCGLIFGMGLHRLVRR